MISIPKGASVFLLSCALGVVGLATAHQATATPYIHVLSKWSITFQGYEPTPGTLPQPLPVGIDLSCLGAGCSDIRSLITDVTSSESLAVDSIGGVAITNNSGQPFSGGQVFFALQYGPFNPGGLEVGLSIDNPLTQSANFRSTINSSDSNPSLDVSSTVSCGIGAGGYFGQVFSPTTCGLSAPDESIAQLVH